MDKIKQLEFRLNSSPTDYNTENKNYENFENFRQKNIQNGDIFEINYQIENTTPREVQFFLNPTSLIAQAASSMTLFTVYKMYRNGVYDTMDGPFYEKMYPEQDEMEDITDYNSPDAMAFISKLKQKYQDRKKQYINDYKKNGGESTNEDWIVNNQKLMNTIVTLQPNEVKNFVIQTSWHRNRYIKIADYEFYLDEKDKFEIQLLLILNKSDRKQFLTEKELSNIKNNLNFIEGTVTSNRMEISFN